MRDLDDKSTDLNDAEREAARRLRLQSILFPDMMGEQPFFAGSKVRLTAGELRPLSAADSALGVSGLVGNLITERSYYSLDTTKGGPVDVWLEPEARIEFSSSDENTLIGHRFIDSDGNVRWTYVAMLKPDIFAIVREFGEAVEASEVGWRSPAACLVIEANPLEPLPPVTDVWDVSFVGTISSIKVGGPAAT